MKYGLKIRLIFSERENKYIKKEKGVNDYENCPIDFKCGFCTLR
jgi:hypothetical protein